MGSVWKAINKRTGEIVAMKIVPLEDGDQGLEDIMGEIEVLKDCSHKNIVAYAGAWLKEKELWVLPHLLSLLPPSTSDHNGCRLVWNIVEEGQSQTVKIFWMNLSLKNRLRLYVRSVWR